MLFGEQQGSERGGVCHADVRFPAAASHHTSHENHGAANCHEDGPARAMAGDGGLPPRVAGQSERSPANPGRTVSFFPARSSEVKRGKAGGEKHLAPLSVFNF